MNFDFHLPVNLITGENGIVKNAKAIAALGNKAFIVTSGTAAEKSGALGDVKAALESMGIPYEIHSSVLPNPLLEDAYNAGQKAVSFGAKFIIGIGGGSAIDASKAVSIYAANPDLELLSIYNKDWEHSPLPLVAVGTTAGTGTEVNQIAVLTMPNGKKGSINDSRCFPALSFGDARYTYTLPLGFTISTALDALSHALEGYFSLVANKMSDLFALEAIGQLYPILKELSTYSSIDQIRHDQRELLHYASICAGFTLSRCGTLYCHPLGYFLSEEYDVPHGTACAIFLPGFIRREVALVKEKSENLRKALGDNPENLALLIEGFTGDFNLKITKEKAKEIVLEKMNSANFTNTAPNGLSYDEAVTIITGLLT